jgi:hypothetical protein
MSVIYLPVSESNFRENFWEFWNAENLFANKLQIAIADCK